ncbi:class A beta-lactamase [Sphingomonas lenta]|uniref:class A beta-lactamase n=1 Tax=Sphingomonas lenta TaxID=1141887 RepID=UPI001C3EED71|nr:class A beta-lactamase [Sphingomonas lenta]
MAASAWAQRGPATFGGDAFRRGVLLLEREAQGRLGLAILDTGTGARFSHRADERFPMCSTFKLPLAAAVLAEVDRGRERLDRRIAIAASDIVAHSPFAKPRVGGATTVAELCEATTTESDNAAANLLLPAVGGPAGLTRFMRALDGGVSRLDRLEPVINESLPGDPRDTTSPAAMLAMVRRFALGDALSAASRERLVGWMIANKTGGRRLRAGLPADWRVGDKTGAGERGSDNDVAILWPPNRRPILVASYLTQTPLPFERTNAVHARLARLIAASA